MQIYGVRSIIPVMKRIIKAFGYSFAGVAAAWKSEPAFRQEIVVFAIGTIVAVLLPIGILTTALLISSMILVLLMELANTAIESVVDRISDAHHTLSKKAKDVGSALVLLSIINACVVWGAVLLDLFLSV